jgi:FAD synthetase
MSICDENKMIFGKRVAIAACVTFLLFLNACSVSNSSYDHNVVIAKYNGNHLEVPANQKIVLAGGCFDVLHFGHIEFLKNAKAAGDYLIVALEPDESIINYKRRKPIHTQKERAEILASLRFVDCVVLLPVLKGFIDYKQLVINVCPTVIAVTADDPMLENKKKQASEVGAEVKIVTPRLSNFSSTTIVTSGMLKN